jgi:hypothetical protein
MKEGGIVGATGESGLMARAVEGTSYPVRVTSSRPDHDGASLEVEDDLDFHRRMWRVQRAGWLAMLGIIVVALLGLLGPGLLGPAVIAAPGGLRVEHPRFARADAPQALRVRLPARAPSANGHRLALGRRFVERVRMEAVMPRPVVVEGASDDRVVYAFAGPVAPVATFHFTPRGMGLVRAELWAPGAPPVSFWMVVYP